MEPRKQAIIDALYKFMRQRSGIEFGNYGDVKAFRAEQRSITKDLHQARELMRAVELSDSITADDLIKASRGAFSGRLTIKACQHGDSARTVCGDKGHVWCGDCEPCPSALCPTCHGGNKRPMKPGEVRLDYVTGQYFPTEYRRAVCAVLASALWAFTRDKCMPTVSGYAVREWGNHTKIYGTFATREAADSELKRLTYAFANPSNSSWGTVDEVYGPLKMTGGDWLRAHFRAMFGRGIASRWFS